VQGLQKCGFAGRYASSKHRRRKVAHLSGIASARIQTSKHAIEGRIVQDIFLAGAEKPKPLQQEDDL
jgi:hypothetical protein